MGGDGAILILGTGSVGLIKRGEDSLSIGGYGFPISDEGSGEALGLSAIRHALRTLDGRTRPTQLSQAVTKQFDHAIPDWKSVVSGKRVSVRVDLGGGRSIKKKKKTRTIIQNI